MGRSFFYADVTDNRDPEGLGRVRVRIFGERESVSPWIPVVTPAAGSGSGAFVIPEVEDQVLVMVLDELWTNMAVLGSLWSEKKRPPEIEGAGAGARFLKSPGGGGIVLDDEEGGETVRLLSGDGKTRVEFSVPDEAISFETGWDIALDAKGNISITAEEVEITGEKRFDSGGEKVQITAEKDIAAGADKNLSLKGSTVAMN